MPLFRATLHRLWTAEGQSRAARSVEVFGWLISAEAVVIVLAPHVAASVLHLPALVEQGVSYLRLAGVLGGGVGMLYVVSGRMNAEGFVFASLLERSLMIPVMAVLWSVSLIPGPLALVLAIQDLGSLLWTLGTRRADVRVPPTVETLAGTVSGDLDNPRLRATELIYVAAMLEEGERITARRPGDWIARHVLGVPVLTGTRLIAIRGLDKVEAVEIEHAGGRETIACDGVVFTGRFQPETAILKTSHLTLDPGTGGPAIDQYFRCSDLQFFAAGNLLRPVETSGLCWAEGRIVAANMILGLKDRLPEATPAVPVTYAAPLKYVYPQRFTAQMGVVGPPPLCARVSRAARGRLRLLVDGRELWSHRVNLLPERRITIPTDRLPPVGAQQIHVELIED